MNQDFKEKLYETMVKGKIEDTKNAIAAIAISGVRLLSWEDNLIDGIKTVYGADMQNLVCWQLATDKDGVLQWTGMMLPPHMQDSLLTGRYKKDIEMNVESILSPHSP
jgi:hypothetical protein